MDAPIWLAKSWAWLKKYWKWLIFPVGVIVYIIGRASADKSITVVSPELVGHQGVKEKLDAEAAAKKQAVDEKAAEQLAGIEANRSGQVAAETQKQLDKVESVQGDPAAVNDFLKSVGKDMRK